MGRPADRVRRRDEHDPSTWPDWVLAFPLGTSSDPAVMASIWEEHARWTADRAEWMKEYGVTGRHLLAELSRRRAEFG